MFDSSLLHLKKFWAYLIGKSSEIHDLNLKDILLAKVVLDIHRKKTHSDFILVPLFELKQVHAIDRENAIRSTEKRAEELRKVKDILKEKGSFTRDVLAEYLPSISWIKVVRESEHTFIAYEGNGRLAALQKVFSPSDAINVEVEEYCFNNPAKILRRINRVRKLNGF